MPPVRPISSLGAISDTAAQEDDAMPCAKKAIVRSAMQTSLESVKLTSMIDMPSAEPTTSGSLREKDSEYPRRIIQSAMNPASSTPTVAPMNGSTAKMPTLTMVKCRSSIR